MPNGEGWRHGVDSCTLKTELQADNESLRTEFKEDIRAMSDKLDRVLESLPATKS